MEVTSDHNKHQPRVNLNESKYEQGLRWIVLEVELSSSVRL